MVANDNAVMGGAADPADDGFTDRIRNAITRGELSLAYQPQADVKTGRLTGFEALARWRLGDGTMIPPDVFVPMAEASHAIHVLGNWSLRNACETAAGWMRAGTADLPVAVNLSARQLDTPSFARETLRILSETGLPAANLKLELTETALFEQTTQTRETLMQLRGAGVRLVLDDFGTGYSSLALLRRVPVESLKVDKQFIQPMVEDRDAAAIVQAVIAMAHALDLTVIAEGVETPEQRLFLQAYRCDHLQGYWLSRPLAAADVPDFVQRTAVTPSAAPPPIE